MFRTYALVMIIILGLLSGCAPITVYSSKSLIENISNVYFDAEFEPQRAEGKKYINTFRLALTNKTDRDLVIDWTKTYYIFNGKRNGQFGWKDMTFDQLKGIQSHPKVMVPAGETLSNVIFPLRLIAWDMRNPGRAPTGRTEDAFFPGVIPEGENGIHLRVLQGDRVIQENLSLSIVAEKLKR